MGILQRIRSVFIEDVPAPVVEQRNLNNPAVPLSVGMAALDGYTTEASVTVNTVLGLSEAWRALKVLGETVAAVPFRVFERMADGTKEERPGHPVSILFTVEPNKLSTPFTFLETAMFHAALRGNAYAIIQYNRRDAYVRSLTLVDPQDISAFEMDGELFYKHVPTGKTYAYDEIMHISNTSWNGMAGLDVMKTHRDNFALAISNRNVGKNFYQNGAQPSAALEHPGSLSDKAQERLVSSFTKKYAGAGNSGKIVVLEEGMKYTPISLKPSDSSFIETKRTVVADMARIFGVPQFLLEDLERATFSNIEHLSQLFLTQTILPWCKRFESEINRKLFPRSERGRFYAKFDFDDLLMTDLKSRAEYARTLFNVGALSPDDIRAVSGLNPIPDGFGQKHYVQSNMMDISQPNANPAPTPPEPPTNP